jgi:flavin-dependent dehydrogenase
VLDKLLVDAAAEAGAEVREGFPVTDVVIEDGRVAGIRGPTTERARVVIGADGHHSLVARVVNAPRYREQPPLQVSYYAYMSGLPMDGRYEVCLRPDRGFAAWETNDDLTVVIAGWPFSELAANRTDIEGHFTATLEFVPEFADRFRAATRETRFIGMFVANVLRKPFGPGWALVGDAGYTKDFITGLGISDAFRDAELCTAALDEAFSGARPFEAALAAYQSERDRRSLAFYEFTTMLATLQPLPPELEQLLGAVSRDQDSMDEFARVGGALTSPADFLAEDNVRRLFARAGAPSP